MRKENPLHAKACEVLKIITDGKILFDAKSIDTKIVKKADLYPEKELFPRYHLKALSFLIENNWFDEDALPVVQRLLDELINKLALLSQATNKRKEKLKEKKRQPSIISMLAPQQPSPVTSTDTSVDDLNTDIEIV